MQASPISLENKLQNGLSYIFSGSNNLNCFNLNYSQAARDEPEVRLGSFQIQIVLKNDNAPVRVVDAVFHLVTGSGRIMSLDDLKVPLSKFKFVELIKKRVGFPFDLLCQKESILFFIFLFFYKHILGSHTGRTVPQGALPDNYSAG